ncbi:LysR family transcriptional regulator [Acetivibrio clariflavus]|uniref:Transcriptional regulator n=1 Tax=Acetivibrio clariflavus (strain DSM 19732 / NBRC 101661 / EBR45) TaxID=720554 RepID=G8M1E3_ACECE|nr:LysR family transcriptional regulator [Acetivibrio clariflavus]AEV69158.1 transcriptional regulator [Acetivibrio clariflavus DSM 19732]
MDINFELYKIFYYVAKNKSFSDAAAELHVSQSAISQAIKNLEKKTGSQLFYRKTREIKLTYEGEILFKHVEQAYNFIKTAENKLLESQNLENGEIRIGVSDTVCKYYLIDPIGRFIQKYPKVKIQVINRTSRQILNILKEGIIDFGIVTLPVHSKGIAVENYLSVEDIFVASNKFIELANRRISLTELSSHPLLMLDKNSSTRQNLDSFFQKKQLNLVPEIELESIDLLLEFAKIGLGIAHVLKESAVPFINKGELFEIKLKEKLPPRKLGIVTMKNMPLSRTSSEFINFLRKKKLYN